MTIVVLLCDSLEDMMEFKGGRGTPPDYILLSKGTDGYRNLYTVYAWHDRRAGVKTPTPPASSVTAFHLLMSAFSLLSRMINEPHEALNQSRFIRGLPSRRSWPAHELS